MKKLVILVFVLLVAITGFLLIPFKSTSQNMEAQAYLRVHVRANSNSEQDQSIKYKVKDLIVSFLTPLIKQVSTVDEAKCVLKNNLDQISSIASNFLKDNGFNYSANAKLNNEYFPTRSYKELTLDSGYYDALIVELGSGEGNNWWCVIYPPLCFSEKQDSDEVVYSSIIAEIIKRREQKWKKHLK